MLRVEEKARWEANSRDILTVFDYLMSYVM